MKITLIFQVDDFSCHNFRAGGVELFERKVVHSLQNGTVIHRAGALKGGNECFGIM